MLTGGLWECFNGKEPLGSLEKTSVVLSINLVGLAWLEVSTRVAVRASRRTGWLTMVKVLSLFFVSLMVFSCAFAGHH